MERANTPPRLLRLVFPQWQGSGKRRYLYDGAKLIRRELLAGLPCEEVNVSLDTDIRLEKGIWGYRQILQQLADAREIIGRTNPEKIFLIGGDCGTEVAPVSYLNKVYGGDLAVIWLDAHGDLNSPSTSVSKNFHGMPLRFLLGEGEEDLVNLSFSKIHPSQVIMVGLRELDPPEVNYIEKNGISVLTLDDVEENVKKTAEVVEAKGLHNLYVHIDLDVLDSGKCPWALCLTPDGMETLVLMALLRHLKDKFEIVGISIVELKPMENMDLNPLMELVRFCEEI